MTQHIGSSFNDFLQEDGILEEVNAVAVKRVLANCTGYERAKLN